MVPLPIAGLAVYFALIAAYSAASAWKIVQGRADGSLAWALACLAVSVVTMLGLSLMRPWARRTAVFGLMFMAMLALAAAASCIAGSRPGMALAMTLSTLIPAISIRYLQRPLVKTFFEAKA